jgi:hypothetical protein
MRQSQPQPRLDVATRLTQKIIERFRMTTEHNKSVAERLFDVFNGGELDAADGLVASNYVWNEASQRRLLGLDGFKNRVRSLCISLSGYHATIGDFARSWRQGHSTL